LLISSVFYKYRSFFFELKKVLITSMKKFLLLFIAMAGFGLVALISRSGGLGGSGDIRTNSPVHPRNCSSCHVGATATGGMAILVTDMNNNVVTSYAPNQTYIINVGMQDLNAVVGGFQMECLDGLNAKAGSFTAGANSVVRNVGIYQVAEQSQSTPFSIQPIVGNAVSWTFQWTAPATAGQSLTLYAVGNPANGTGGTGGDVGYVTSLSLASLSVVFESMVFDNQIRLIWDVEELEGANRYLVERAAGQGDFEPIGERAAVGNTRYQFTDNMAPMGTPLRYRIKQIDLDGSSQSSKTLSTVLSPEQGGIARMYPNPLQAGSALNLVVWSDYDGEASLRWLSIDGRSQHTMAQQLIKGENSLSIPSPQKAGNYMLEYKAFGKRETKIVQVH
jgi:hypothetical protein